MVQLITADELAEALGVTFTATDTARANSLITRISGRLQRYCNLVGLTEVTDDEITLPGVYGTDLILPKPPVSSVSSVSVDGTTVTDFELVKNRLVRTYRPNADYPLGHPFRLINHWGGPDVEVAVTYTHGLSTVPDAVKDAAMEMATKAWGNPSAALSLSIDGYSARWSDGGPLTKDIKGDLKTWHRSNGSVDVS